MSYECRIYDKNGNLIKILSPKELINRRDERFFRQKSTMTTTARIRSYRDPKPSDSLKQSLFTRFCIACRKEFYSRRPHTKYCTHECQKIFHAEKKVLLSDQKVGRRSK